MRKLLIISIIIFLPALLIAQNKKFKDVTVYDSLKVSRIVDKDANTNSYIQINNLAGFGIAGYSMIHRDATKLVDAFTSGNVVAGVVNAYIGVGDRNNNDTIFGVNAKDGSIAIITKRATWGHRLYMDDDEMTFMRVVPTVTNYFKVDTFGICTVDSSLIVDGVFSKDRIETDSSFVSAGVQTIASAATIYPVNAQNVEITGTADISVISTAHLKDYTILYIKFQGTAATNGVVAGANIKLAGAANFAYTPDDILVLQLRGSVWYELSRSVN